MHEVLLVQSERHIMKKFKVDKNDDLRPEYDLRELISYIEQSRIMRKPNSNADLKLNLIHLVPLVSMIDF
jgi:hypothetical protein